MSTIPVPDELATADRASGGAILAGLALSIAFAALHPAPRSRTRPEFVAEVASKAHLNGVVHGSLIAVVGVLVAGYSGLAIRLGLASLVVRAGLVAYAVGAAGWTAAAMINGFILPAFLSHHGGRPAGELEVLWPILVLGGEANQASSRLAALAMSAAVACWSVALARRGRRATAGLGAVTALVLSAAILSGHLPMDVHGMMAFLLVQALWGVAVAALLIRGRI